ncbi:MAG: AbrB/MazE/SpoVT family DNA-binding domain-containing protein [Verrucomicrobiales bacterium]
MNATVYGRGQMVIPVKARKRAGIETGDVLSVQPEGDGRIVLVRLDPPKQLAAKVKFIKRKGQHTVASTGRSPITSEQVRSLLDEPR